MKHIIKLMTIVLSLNTARAQERIIYDALTQRSLRNFQLFLEGPLTVGKRAQMTQTPEGLTSQPTHLGGFTLYKFADLQTPNFDVKAEFQIPAGIRYSNSGIYFLYTDPTLPVLEELDPSARRHYEQALENARLRSQRYGAGPYEADFFARELQIIAGFESNLPSDNHGAGAFYGVTPSSEGNPRPGTQKINPYELMIGDTYELRIEVRGLTIKTFLRSLAHQEHPVLVSEFRNLTRTQDPIRGGYPIALLLQMFPMNGQDTRGPVFRHLSVSQYPKKL